MRHLLQHRIGICLFLAASLHGLILLTPFERQEAPRTETTLQVRLNKTPLSNAQTDPEPEMKVSAETQVTSSENQATVSVHSEVFDEPANESIQPPLNTDDIVTATKSLLMAPKPSFKTFSREDFRPKDNEIDTDRPGSLPLLLSVNTPTSSMSYTGHATDLLRGADGKSMCWQQRGIPGEPPQWYRVPLALCGHLK